MNKPIFILGCTKSGTTLMRNLFDGHPDLFVIPTETHFLQFIGKWVDYDSRRSKPEELSFEEMKKNLYRWIEKMNYKENHHSDGFTVGKWNLPLLRKELFDTEVDSVKSLYSLFCKSLYKSLYNSELEENKRVVEKSIENAEFVPYLKSVFPDAQFIHIVRNPYSNLVSLRKFIGKKRKQKYPIIKQAIYEMNNSFYHLYMNSEIIENYKVVKYEDLVENADIVMKDLSDFLGIRFSKELLTPTLLGEIWRGNSMSGNKFNSISDYSIDRWQNEITPYEIKLINNMFSFVCEKYGYEEKSTNQSIFLPTKESPLTFIANRLLLYFLPKFKLKSLFFRY